MHQIKFFINHFLTKFQNSNARTHEILKNIALSVSVKIANILSSLLIMPLTINYVNPTQYGIWLSLSSIIAWINFFDLGLANGFRNKFAEAKANGNTLLARQYLSTTYFTITIIVLVLYCATIIINSQLDWTSVLNVDQTYREELQKVFAIVCGFMCLNMVANIFSTLLTADQKPGYASIIQGAGQYISLLVIFILTKVSSGSLTNLALYYAGIPCMVMLFTSIIMFNVSSYRKYKPKIRFIQFKLIRSILGKGSQFFVIYLCIIAVFQLVNIILSREIGPNGVTEYNVANRYFNILYMSINIIIAPFWSAFTDAYVKRDFTWMKSSLHNLEKLFILTIFGGIIMLIISPFFYKIWIGDNVNIPFILSASVLILTLSRTISNIYMFLINGIGAIRIQLIIYVCFALIAWPAMVYSCRNFGISGIVIIPTAVYIVQSILARIQLNKHINGKAYGIWLK